jgi:hypothetical protein
MPRFAKTGEENIALFESPMPITTDADAADADAPNETAAAIETSTRKMRLDIRNSTFPPIEALEFVLGPAAGDRIVSPCHVGASEPLTAWLRAELRLQEQRNYDASSAVAPQNEAGVARW